MNTSSAQTLRDKIFVEQVRSLFANTVPASIMLLAFAGSVVIAYLDYPSRLLEAIGGLAFIACSARLAISSALRSHALTAVLDRRSARRLELVFALPYVAFSMFLGLFAGLVFLLHSPQIHMLAICLVVGYCAGVATNCGQRPWLAISSMTLAVVPPVAVAFFAQDPAHVATALITSSFLGAGAQSVIVRHRASEREIGQRLSAAFLARRDTLTSLPNRLALGEFFRESALGSPNRLVAVHYLDLDGFKQVNDQHGHAVGDALLSMVAERLRDAVRGGDIAARLGGDEFAVVQFGLDNPGDADMLARRIGTAIRMPYAIEGLALSISTSVGTVVTQEAGQGLECLLEQADAQLYEAKSQRRVPYLRIVTA